ncbi:MAG TPA: histidine kinase [Flavobacteriaceae bacterium]|nr:histidine kinase [Flavobacteriaceae bacterium]HAT63606.1 histidine kinase [Flavobacteriaceae bacterium]|tara:strand:- start:729 stop:1646 length:918 start_codon:yes stop_codon:yes gene_type:complete
MKDMDKNYILHKYLNGEATIEEIELLKNDSKYTSYVKIAEATQGFETPAFKAEETFTAIKSKNDLKKGKVRSLFSSKYIVRIAAVLALIVTSYLFLENRDTSITTDIAQKENFLLPDESEVTLNAMSQLAYNKKGWDKERKLSLEGEAYFKVKKGSTFSVETPQGTVTVLGTQFNVFSRKNQFNITCYEGLVSVAFSDTLVKIPAGNYITIENNKIVNNESLALNAPTWVNNESSFENVLVTDVLAEFKRQYPVTIHTELNLNKRFTGSFTHTNLTVALRSICDPLQLDFTIANNEVTLYAKNSN